MNPVALALTVVCWVPILLLVAYFAPPIAVVLLAASVAFVGGLACALVKARAKEPLDQDEPSADERRQQAARLR